MKSKAMHLAMELIAKDILTDFEAAELTMAIDSLHTEIERLSFMACPNHPEACGCEPELEQGAQ